MTKEIRNEKGRQGFKAQDYRGREMIISHKTDIVSAYRVGQNYVDLKAVETMFATILPSNNQDESDTQADAIFIDEIGPIQMLSLSFRKQLERLFSDAYPTTVIATIHQSEPTLNVYRDSDKVILLTVTEANRTLLADNLYLFVNNGSAYDKLSTTARQRCATLARDYVSENKTLQLEKLLDNAIYYASDGQALQHSPNQWRVYGRHGVYNVIEYGDDIYSCICDLYIGRGLYAKNQGECSHIQAVKLVK